MTHEQAIKKAESLLNQLQAELDGYFDDFSNLNESGEIDLASEMQTFCRQSGERLAEIKREYNLKP